MKLNRWCILGIMIFFLLTSYSALSIPTTIAVNAGLPTGKAINKDLLGVNHGPVHITTISPVVFDHESSNWTDLSAYYQSAHISWVRTDEQSGGNVNTIFPHDSTYDVNNPDNYDFSDVDIYIKKCLDAGCKVVYRLGYGDQLGSGYVNPPLNNDRYATICLNIVRHFNDGWANGHHWNIKYWEFWNEPDLVPATSCPWQGTPEQFAQLYHAVVTKLKNYDSTLKVGAYGAAFQLSDFRPNIATGANDVPSFANPFLAYCRDHAVPMDFFSWHMYPTAMNDLANKMIAVRTKLGTYGYGNAEIMITEWAGQYLHDSVDDACMLEGTLALLQDSGATMVAYYTGSPYCQNPLANPYNGQWGMFDPRAGLSNPAPRKNYFGAKAYGELMTDSPNRLTVAAQGFATPPLAGKSDDNNRVDLIINNLSSNNDSYTVNFTNLPFSSAVVDALLLDSTHNLTPIAGSPSVHQVSGGGLRYQVPTVEYPSLVLLRVHNQAVPTPTPWPTPTPMPTPTPPPVLPNGKVRYEAELYNNTQAPTINDRAGYAYVLGAAPNPYADVSASGGKYIMVTNQINTSVKFIFVGTGIDVVGPQLANGRGSIFNWSLDEGAQTGTISFSDTATTVPQAVRPIVSGLPRTLHTLKLTCTTSDMRLDAFDVADNEGFTRVDDASNNIGYTGWYNYPTISNYNMAYENTVHMTTQRGSSAMYQFSGTAISVLGIAWAGQIYNVNWNIDGIYQGTMNLEAEASNSQAYMFRWPMLLKNNLANGNHTLTITTAAVGPGAIFCLDAFDSYIFSKWSSAISNWQRY